MIGAPVGIAIGADLDVLRIGSIVATEAADTVLIQGIVLVTGDIAATEDPDTVALSGVVTTLTGYILATEGADVAAFVGSSRIPFSAARSIVGGRAKGPVSAGRAVSGVGGGYGRATVGR